MKHTALVLGAGAPALALTDYGSFAGRGCDARYKGAGFSGDTAHAREGSK